MEQGKRVLIITYYWPPSGGSGVQRWLKFVKYLVDLGWKPVIYTPENPEFPSIDESLLSNVPKEVEIIRTTIWEPYSIYKRVIGQDKNEGINAGFITTDEKPGKLEHLSRWIRGNFFIPDARKFWIRPSIKFLTNYLKQHPIDLMISTGPPHSMHLIAHGVKKNLHTPWIADFRDPWTQIDFYDDLLLTKRADKKHHRLEKRVLSDADHVLVVGKVMKEAMSQLADTRAMTAIPNGFDSADYSSRQSLKPDEQFTIAHIGSFTSSRNPSMLWKVLADKCRNDDNFRRDLRIRAIGKTDISIVKELDSLGLGEQLERVDYLPHDEVIQQQLRAQVLLLVVNRTSNQKMILTGKIFEYLNSGRPILAIGPVDGELSHLLRSCGIPAAFDYEDEVAIRQMVDQLYSDFCSKSLPTPVQHLDRFTRENLTRQLSAIMEEVVGNHSHTGSQ